MGLIGALISASVQAEEALTPVFQPGGLARETMGAALIVLCSEPSMLTTRDVADFAKRLHPDRRTPQVINGLVPRSSVQGKTVYTYYGDMNPSRDLNKCAEGIFQKNPDILGVLKELREGIGNPMKVPGFEGNSYQEIIERDMGVRLGGSLSLTSIRRKDDDVFYITISVIKDDLGKADFLGGLFGLEPTFCILHCRSLLARAE